MVVTPGRFFCLRWWQPLYHYLRRKNRVFDYECADDSIRLPVEETFKSLCFAVLTDKTIHVFWFARFESFDQLVERCYLFGFLHSVNSLEQCHRGNENFILSVTFNAQIKKIWKKKRTSIPKNPEWNWIVLIVSSASHIQLSSGSSSFTADDFLASYWPVVHNPFRPWSISKILRRPNKCNNFCCDYAEISWN